jgi:hypothetical protein
MKFRNPFQSAIKRNFLKEAELKLYEKVAKDIENNDINNGVWTKAYAKSDGDVAKQKSIYIELMVELYEDKLRAEEELEVILASAASKAQARETKEEFNRRRDERIKKQAKADEEAGKKRHAEWLANKPKREELEKKRNFWALMFVIAYVIIFIAAITGHISS